MLCFIPRLNHFKLFTSHIYILLMHHLIISWRPSPLYDVEIQRSVLILSDLTKIFERMCNVNMCLRWANSCFQRIPDQMTHTMSHLWQQNLERMKDSSMWTWWGQCNIWLEKDQWPMLVLSPNTTILIACKIHKSGLSKASEKITLRKINAACFFSSQTTRP